MRDIPKPDDVNVEDLIQDFKSSTRLLLGGPVSRMIDMEIGLMAGHVESLMREALERLYGKVVYFVCDRQEESSNRLVNMALALGGKDPEKSKNRRPRA